MSILDMAKVPTSGAIIASIYGEAGMGKTSLAATFPNPIFIRAEDGLKSIPLNERPKALPLISDADSLFNQLMALVREVHDYKTVVIDSVTVLEEIFITQIVDEWKKANPMKVNSSTSIKTVHGGYGAGFEAVGALHGRVRKAAEILKNKGINVIFLMHSTTEIVDPPDSQPFTRYTLNMNKRSLVHYEQNVDLVGFIKLEMYLQGDDGMKKAISTGQRVLTCHKTANNMSKNRFGIEEDIPLNKGENPLVQYIAQPTQPTQPESTQSNEEG